MCGRYATTKSEADLGELFDAVAISEAPAASWNVAPTDPVPLIRMSERHDARVVDTARWGLVPPWAEDLRAGSRMINARAETVAQSPAFAPSFQRRRCLVPADGWYEWVRTGKQRQAYYMTPLDSSVLAFAGIWTMWRGEALTCSVLTTAALGGLRSVHDRMPLILPAERWPAWLAGGGDAGELLRPLPEHELAAIEVRPVGPGVGNVRNNGPELIAPAAAPAKLEATLF
ncbi:SOS response-associated peptidase [Couchioplanes caeruleus]|uniref:SOS response-associated peptidase n=1 Tax=Couchioplanes caeruleus TaxID=56438 RepID=UPI0020BF9505|nr:SOS response-associated peptidase [Couchioplanes caeruleus]UQU65932.1 SOS response-associated peptidase [Couchioplanes caeruleus]